MNAPTIAIRSPSARPPETLAGRLIALLDAPCTPYETLDEGFARKERELGAMFAALAAGEARAMRFRLTACKAGDELANKFARLSLERRARLLVLLLENRGRPADDGV
ncbi:MAG: hypothetical protein SFX73_27990 [Kofleriaceae bacterium]|nr:hypothetical protein [Kofleriaceae bacterium]